MAGASLVVAEEYVAARRALLDALEALETHLESLVLVGSQAIYLRSGNQTVGTPNYTTDADLAIDPDLIATHPDIAEMMSDAGFQAQGQPGHWLNAAEVAIDLMVPAGAIPDQSGRRARIEGHDEHTARRTPGLELCIVSNSRMTISALEPTDLRAYDLAVASFAALLVAKLIKVEERSQQQPGRQLSKDATDILLILRRINQREVAEALAEARQGPTSEYVMQAMDFLRYDLAQRQPHLSRLAILGSQGYEDSTVVDVSVRTLGIGLLDAFDLANKTK